jgi:hypothetical protein
VFDDLAFKGFSELFTTSLLFKSQLSLLEPAFSLRLTMSRDGSISFEGNLGSSKIEIGSEVDRLEA